MKKTNSECNSISQLLVDIRNVVDGDAVKAVNNPVAVIKKSFGGDIVWVIAEPVIVVVTPALTATLINASVVVNVSPLPAICKFRSEPTIVARPSK